MKNVKIPSIIFVYGNPINKVREMAQQFNITVVGTNDPATVVDELEKSNDVKSFFFLVTNEQDLEGLNNVFKSIMISSEEGKEFDYNFYVIANKEFEKRIAYWDCDYNLMLIEEPLNEKHIDENVLRVGIFEQTQYQLREPERVQAKSSANRIKNTVQSVNRTAETTNALLSIRSRFEEISEKQKSLSIADLLDADNNNKYGKQINLETQNFLKEKLDDIQDQLRVAHNKEDKEQIMEIVLEIYSLMAKDLEDSSKEMMQKLVEDALERSKNYSIMRDEISSEIDKALLEQDDKTLQSMIDKRDRIIKEVRTMEHEVNNRANTLKVGLTGQFNALKELVTSTVKENSDIVKDEQKTALMAVYNESSKNVALASKDLVTNVTGVINELQHVVENYSRLVDYDTAIIEGLQRKEQVLKTQKVVENVQYQNSLTSKIRVLVSPTSNLGASTLVSMHRNKFESILMLDFRGDSSNAHSFGTMTYDEFLNSDIDGSAGQEYVQVVNELAEDVEENNLLKKLEQVEDYFEIIFVVVDKMFTTAIPIDLIQRLYYISNAKDNNLLAVNEVRSMYESLLQDTGQIKQVNFVLNFCTSSTKVKLNEYLTIAGIDPSEVRVNIMSLRNNLMGGENIDMELKSLHKEFRY